MARVLLHETQRKHFGGINIGDLNKIISCMCLNLQLGVNFNVDVLPKWYSRYGNQSISVEYLPIFALSLAEHSHWQAHFLPTPLVVTLSPIVFVYGCSLVEAGSLIIKSTVMVRKICFAVSL